MEKQKPFVSVIIPTYKRPDTLTRAVDSVLNQTYSNLEIIVVDDNNPGTEGRYRTEEIMSAYNGNEKVKYIKHECNKNGSAARNTGVKHSQGVYIAFLDDDDEFLPEKIALQVERMESLSDEWAACYTCSYTEFNGKRELDRSETREGNYLKEALKREFKSGAGSNLLMRKTAFMELGGFDESFTRNQDYELVVKIFTKYKISYVDVPSLVIHAHPCSMSVDYDYITDLFIQSFKQYIDALPQNDRKEVYNSLNEQRFVAKIRIKKDIRGSVKMIVSGDISVVRAVFLLVNGFINYVKNRI